MEMASNIAISTDKSNTRACGYCLSLERVWTPS